MVKWIYYKLLFKNIINNFKTINYYLIFILIKCIACLNFKLFDYYLMMSIISTYYVLLNKNRVNIIVYFQPH